MRAILSPPNLPKAVNAHLSLLDAPKEIQSSKSFQTKLSRLVVSECSFKLFNRIELSSSPFSFNSVSTAAT
nr:Transcription termination/antitermination protein NusA [Leptospira interrogans serovar Copenhageni/Icterohaemorrhagiae]